MAKMTAYQWLTSDAPAAVAWRKQATMPAWSKVYERAQRDNEHGATFFKKQVDPIERPLTGRETTGGKFFDVPVTNPNAQTGQFFAIPEQDK